MTSRIVFLAHRYIYIPLAILVLSGVAMVIDHSHPVGIPGKVTEAKVTPKGLRLSYQFERRRICDAEVSRQVEQRGILQALPTIYVSSAGVAAMEDKAPGMLHQLVPVYVEPNIPMALRVSILYRCNLTHAIWPIRLDYQLRFTPTDS